MYKQIDLFVFIFNKVLSIETSSNHYRTRENIFLHNHSRLVSTTVQPILTESIFFFQNEPVPLPANIVDDLTTLALTIYIICLIGIVFILLAWITHYNAPCSSIITSILSTLTGLPEPIIHSVALCGSCCLWCEGTWLFRRIHQFNIWTSNKINVFVSDTCKVLYDTICPCCRPPDTPSNRSIIGSVTANFITRINIPNVPDSLPIQSQVTITEPVSVVHCQSCSLVTQNQLDQSKSTKKKDAKRPRKRTQPLQRTAMNEMIMSDGIDDDENDSLDQ